MCLPSCFLANVYCTFLVLIILLLLYLQVSTLPINKVPLPNSDILWDPFTILPIFWKLPLLLGCAIWAQAHPNLDTWWLLIGGVLSGEYFDILFILDIWEFNGKMGNCEEGLFNSPCIHMNTLCVRTSCSEWIFVCFSSLLFLFIIVIPVFFSCQLFKILAALLPLTNARSSAQPQSSLRLLSSLLSERRYFQPILQVLQVDLEDVQVNRVSKISSWVRICWTLHLLNPFLGPGNINVAHPLCSEMLHPGSFLCPGPPHNPARSL